MTHPPKLSGPPPRRRDPRATHERLVRAALDLFTTQGYHATTTPEIARRAGVAEGTIYRHFDSKEHLLNEIYRGAVKLFGKSLKESQAHLPCRDRLAAVAFAWRDVAGKDAALVRLAFLSRLSPMLDDRSRDARQELERDLERLIASGKAAGDIKPGAVELWGAAWLRLITLMLERVANKEWSHDHGGPRQVVDAAWDAIRAGGDASGAVPPPPPAAGTA